MIFKQKQNLKTEHYGHGHTPHRNMMKAMKTMSNLMDMAPPHRRIMKTMKTMSNLMVMVPPTQEDNEDYENYE